MAAPNEWSRRIAAEAVKKAKARAGAGWGLFSADIHEALVSREILMVLLSQGDETMTANPAMARVADAARLALTAVEG